MLYLFFYCCLMAQNPLCANIKFELEQLNQQLQSLGKNISEANGDSTKPKTSINSCAKELLGLEANDYDLLLTTARYEPFRQFLSSLVYPLDSIISTVLKIDDLDKLNDRNYQEFYFLAKDRHDKTGYIMHQIVLFNCALENITNFSWYERYINNKNKEVEVPVPPKEVPGPTKEQYQRYLEFYAYKYDMTPQQLYQNLGPEAVDKMIREMHQSREGSRMHPQMETKKFSSLSIAERAKFIEITKTVAHIGVPHGIPLKAYFMQYLKSWQNIEKENKRLATTIQKIAGKRGLSIENNSAVLYRTVYWNPTLPVKNVIRLGLNQLVPKRWQDGTIDVFDSWYNNLSDSLKNLEWLTSSEEVTATLQQNCNIILDDNVTQKEVYELIIKKYPKFRIKPLPFNNCLIFNIMPNDDWSSRSS